MHLTGISGLTPIKCPRQHRHLDEVGLDVIVEGQTVDRVRFGHTLDEPARESAAISSPREVEVRAQVTKVTHNFDDTVYGIPMIVAQPFPDRVVVGEEEALASGDKASHIKDELQKDLVLLCEEENALLPNANEDDIISKNAHDDLARHFSEDDEWSHENGHEQHRKRAALWYAADLVIANAKPPSNTIVDTQVIVKPHVSVNDPGGHASKS